MSFKDLIFLAKQGDDTAILGLLDMYRPLLMKESILNGMFDEDLFQEQCIVLMRCIKVFKE